MNQTPEMDEKKTSSPETAPIAATAEHNANFEENIRAIIRSGKPASVIRDDLDNYHANDIAEVLETLDTATRKRLYNILCLEMTAEICTYLDEPAPYLHELGLDRAAAVLAEMDADEAVDILENLDPEEKEALIARMDQESKDDIHLIFSYDEEQIGSRMTTNYIVIPNNCTIKQAMRHLISQAEDNDNIDTIYVEDENGRYFGAIELKDLITAREYMKLEDIISTSYPYVYADERSSDCMEELIDYSEDSIPVLDRNHKIIGAITYEDIAEAIDDEMGDDYAKLAGLSAEEDLEEPIFRSVKKRLPWLFVLLVMGLGVSATVGLFESIVAQLPVIMSFQSLILDMAGNVGTQSLAVAIRVLMDKQTSGKQKLTLILKESRVGLTNGFILGISSFLVIGGYLVLKGNELSFAFAVSGCLGAAMILAMLISSLSGTVIPIFFQKIGVDPAVASGPLITTVNDLVAVITYYGLAWVILINLLHLA